jgi:hypothetical protein
MSDVILGAVIGLIASLLTTIVIKVVEWQREKLVRWDEDILQIATDALISAERARAVSTPGRAASSADRPAGLVPRRSRRPSISATTR